MTNKEAIETLTFVYERNHKEDLALKMAIKALEEQDKHRWIPVSERLPSKEGYYITTTKYNDVYCDYWGGDNLINMIHNDTLIYNIVYLGK